MKSKNELWRGVQSLVEVAVDQGVSAVERIHLATAARTFVVLDAIPVVSTPANMVRAIHDGIVVTSYAATRGVNRLVGMAVRAGFEVAFVTEPPTTHALAAPASLEAAE